MAKTSTRNSTDTPRKSRPAMTPEGRENQLISLATNLAEQQLRDGTASSQVITHYLKLATAKERLELEIKEKEKELITAKTEALQSQKRSEQLFAEAIKAFRVYSGAGGESDEQTEY